MKCPRCRGLIPNIGSIHFGNGEGGSLCHNSPFKRTRVNVEFADDIALITCLSCLKIHRRLQEFKLATHPD